jgi:glycosyltransferase involved in cell wall biosynthesis
MSIGQVYPLISVIIPCYNHAHFLKDAIQSVIDQSYPNKEIIVVNDGSTDDTVAVASSFPSVRLVNQINLGPSAARNSGIEVASGTFLVFLDADDILLPEGLKNQYQIISKNDEFAFVSGGHATANQSLELSETVAPVPDKTVYEELLTRNFIGMHAAVMYRKSVMEKYLFDTSLTGCEDYDVFLRIAADHPVVHHAVPIAVYRTVHSGLSHNLTKMLEQAIKVLNKQKARLRSKEQIKYYKEGIKNWIDLYCYSIYAALKTNKNANLKKQYLKTLKKYKRKLYVKYFLTSILGL